MHFGSRSILKLDMLSSVAHLLQGAHTCHLIPLSEKTRKDLNSVRGNDFKENLVAA